MKNERIKILKNIKKENKNAKKSKPYINQYFHGFI